MRATETSSDEPESLKDRNEDIGAIVIVVVSERSSERFAGKVTRSTKWSASSAFVRTKSSSIRTKKEAGSFRTERDAFDIRRRRKCFHLARPFVKSLCLSPRRRRRRRDERVAFHARGKFRVGRDLISDAIIFVIISNRRRIDRAKDHACRQHDRIMLMT